MKRLVKRINVKTVADELKRVFLRMAPKSEEPLVWKSRGRIRVPIDEVLPLEQAAQAHQRILDRRVRGKLLLRP